MNKSRILSVWILLFGVGVGFFVWWSEQPRVVVSEVVTTDSTGATSTQSISQNEKHRFAFKLGLDLAGGTQLIYRADTERLIGAEVNTSMDALREVIERRVNLFGVGEPLVQIERSGVLSGSREERLIVELPGVMDIDDAVAQIGRTPLLEFKLLSTDPLVLLQGTSSPGDLFVDTGLTGRMVKRAQLQFGGASGGPQGGLPNEAAVIVDFNNEGRELFADITRNNVGGVLGIFLDGEPITVPTIQTEITQGTAVITGSFTPEQARTLVRDLNFGALPVPIELVSTQTVGATLGSSVVQSAAIAGLVGFGAVALFLLAWYGGMGAVAVLSLLTYAVLMLALFKLIPVTLTAAGLTGFILSIGMAVDANILIFERIKEERRARKSNPQKGAQSAHDVIQRGFTRAWVSIRDANLSSLLTAVILFWFGTSLVKGFALTFGVGVLVSMVTAVSVSRTFLFALAGVDSTDVRAQKKGTRS